MTHLLPICYWNWTWDSTRANYTYEREVLSGIILLSGQGRLLRSNLLVWFCDQQSTKYFLTREAPENWKLRQWWTYLA